MDRITAALGVTKSDLFPDKPRNRDYGTVEREHIYPGGNIKKVMYRRSDGSKFGCWFHKSGNAWAKGRGGAPPTLYIAGELAGAVFVCEGEKDADTLHGLGYNAATGADGAGPGKMIVAVPERVLHHFRPALCVFDPIQGFTPPKVNMGSRNEMRDCTAQLITIGEDINTTALIVCHTNKRKGAYGRDRIADSADIWDIARSVLMAGFTEDQGVRYLSNEKTTMPRSRRPGEHYPPPTWTKRPRPPDTASPP